MKNTQKKWWLLPVITYGALTMLFLLSPRNNGEVSKSVWDIFVETQWVAILAALCLLAGNLFKVWTRSLEKNNKNQGKRE